MSRNVALRSTRRRFKEGVSLLLQLEAQMEEGRALSPRASRGPVKASPAVSERRGQVSPIQRETRGSTRSATAVGALGDDVRSQGGVQASPAINQRRAFVSPLVTDRRGLAQASPLVNERRGVPLPSYARGRDGVDGADEAASAHTSPSVGVRRGVGRLSPKMLSPRSYASADARVPTGDASPRSAAERDRLNELDAVKSASLVARRKRALSVTITRGRRPSNGSDDDDDDSDSIHSASDDVTTTLDSDSEGEEALASGGRKRGRRPSGRSTGTVGEEDEGSQTKPQGAGDGGESSNTVTETSDSTAMTTTSSTTATVIRQWSDISTVQQESDVDVTSLGGGSGSDSRTSSMTSLPPVHVDPDSRTASNTSILTVLARSSSVGSLAAKFRREVMLEDRRVFPKTYRQVFTGTQVVDWILSNTASDTRDTAAHVAGEMLEQRVIWPVTSQSVPFADRNVLYSLHDPANGSNKPAAAIVDVDLSRPVYSALRYKYGHVGAVHGTCMDEHFVYSVSEDRTVRVYNRHSHTESFVLHPDVGRGIQCVHTDAKYVYIGCADHSLRVFNKFAWTETANLVGHSGSVVSIQSDHEFIYSAGLDNTVRVWRKETFLPETVLMPPSRDPVISASWMDTQAVYAASSEGICVYNKDAAFTFRTLLPAPDALAVHSDDSYLYAGCSDGRIFVWDVVTLQPHAEISTEHDTRIHTIASNDKHVFSGSADGTVVMLRKPKARGAHGGIDNSKASLFRRKAVWRPAKDSEFEVLDMALDDSTLVIACSDSNIWVLAARTFKKLAVHQGGAYQTESIWYDDRYIYAGCDDGIVRVWDKKTLKKATMLRGHRDTIRSMFSDDHYVYTCSLDQTCKIWSKKNSSFKLKATLTDQSDAVWCVFAQGDKLWTSSFRGTTLAYSAVAGRWKLLGEEHIHWTDLESKKKAYVSQRAWRPAFSLGTSDIVLTEHDAASLKRWKDPHALVTNGLVLRQADRQATFLVISSDTLQNSKDRWLPDALRLRVRDAKLLLSAHLKSLHSRK